MHVSLEKPILYCDNRAAVHLSAGSSEWRTKALANRVCGVRSLIDLPAIVVLFRPTLEMEADCLTKYMGNKVLSRLRLLIGCVPPGRTAG